MILADTSALFAVVSEDDLHHRDAVSLLAAIRGSREDLLIHTYVLAETFALLHRRHSLELAIRVSDDVSDCLAVAVDRPLHDRAVAWLRRPRARRFSIVDAVSFVLMRERGIEAAFAFDPDFEKAGFRLFRAPP